MHPIPFIFHFSITFLFLSSCSLCSTFSFVICLYQLIVLILLHNHISKTVFVLLVLCLYVGSLKCNRPNLFAFTSAFSYGLGVDDRSFLPISRIFLTQSFFSHVPLSTFLPSFLLPIPRSSSIHLILLTLFPIWMSSVFTTWSNHYTYLDSSISPAILPIVVFHIHSRLVFFHSPL